MHTLLMVSIATWTTAERLKQQTTGGEEQLHRLCLQAMYRGSYRIIAGAAQVWGQKSRHDDSPQVQGRPGSLVTLRRDELSFDEVGP